MEFSNKLELEKQVVEFQWWGVEVPFLPDVSLASSTNTEMGLSGLLDTYPVPRPTPTATPPKMIPPASVAAPPKVISPARVAAPSVRKVPTNSRLAYSSTESEPEESVYAADICKWVELPTQEELMHEIRRLNAENLA